MRLGKKQKPDIPKDIPRKKGIARFFELIATHYRDMLLVNLLFFVCALPAVALFAIGILGVFEPGLYLSIPAAFPIGSGVAASMFCLTRLMRDDPSFVFDDFKRKFRENLRGAAFAGILVTTFIFTQLFMFWVPILLDWDVAEMPWVIAGIVLFLLVAMTAPYIFLHFAYINLGALTIIKNSILLAFGNFIRSFLGAVIGLLPWVALLMFLPVSFVLFPLIPLVMFVLSWLLTLMWVWPVFDRHFKVEETLKRERR